METNTSNSATRPMGLLSIDGGGLKGLIPAEALIAIETQLDALTGRSLPLSDRFDLIGGTSTGAILAVGLALGLKAATFETSISNSENISSPRSFCPSVSGTAIRPVRSNNT